MSSQTRSLGHLPPCNLSQSSIHKGSIAQQTQDTPQKSKAVQVQAESSKDSSLKKAVYESKFQEKKMPRSSSVQPRQVTTFARPAGVPSLKCNQSKKGPLKVCAPSRELPSQSPKKRAVSLNPSIYPSWWGEPEEVVTAK